MARKRSNSFISKNSIPKKKLIIHHDKEIMKRHNNSDNFHVSNVVADGLNNRALTEKYMSSSEKNQLHNEISQMNHNNFYKKKSIDGIKIKKLNSNQFNMPDGLLVFEDAFQTGKKKKDSIATSTATNNVSNTIFSDEELQEIKEINPFKDVAIDKEKDVVLSGFQKPIEFKYSNSYLNKMAALNNFLLSSRPSPIEKEISISILSNNENFLEIFQELLIEIHTKKTK